MNEDFDFYGSEAEQEEIKDIKGITDEVSKFVYSNMEFPCVCLREGLELPKHKWLVISKLVKQGAVSKNISFYLIKNGELFKAGSLTGLQIKAFIDIVGIENLFGYHDKNTKLEDDKLYVLASSF